MGRLELRSTTRVHVEEQPRLPRCIADDGDSRGAGSSPLIRQGKIAKRLAKLAQPRGLPSADLGLSRHERLGDEPGPRFLRGAETVPLRREVVVPGIHEALQERERVGRLRSATGLDLLTDESFLAFVHALVDLKPRPS